MNPPLSKDQRAAQIAAAKERIAARLEAKAQRRVTLAKLRKKRAKS